MPQKIEQLYLDDLRTVFNAFLQTQEQYIDDQRYRDRQWALFMAKLRRLCSIVDTY